MDRDTFAELLTPVGQAALATADKLAPSEAVFLGAFEKLRKRYPAPLAKAALETVLLRVKARAKFPQADEMYFTRESLEQASARLVAEYRSNRFSPYESVFDLCCGIGADTLALAEAGCQVTAIDSDELRLEMAKANLAVSGEESRVTFRLGDVCDVSVNGERAAFLDPGRRAGERRFLDPDTYRPPLSEVLARLPAGFPIGVKIAPGVSRADLSKWDASSEFISVERDLKECVLWFGPLRTATSVATVLPGPHTLLADSDLYEATPSEPQAFLFDPDPAVVRANLVPLLGQQLDAVPVDHGIAVLTGSKAAKSPFAQCHAIEHAAPFHLGKLRDYLRAHHVGRVTLLKRAVDLDVNEVMRKFKLDGSEHRTVMLVRSLGRPWAVVCGTTT